MKDWVFAVLILILIPLLASEFLPDTKEESLLEECEKSLPRNQECEIIITAKPKQIEEKN